MRAWSNVSAKLLHPSARSAWVALAAGSLAGLAILGACSDAPVSKVAAPRNIPSAPLGAVGILGDNHHVISVCVNPLSPDGTYSFAITPNTVFANQAWPEQATGPNSSDGDLSGFGIGQPNGSGPWRTGTDNDVITTPTTITLPGVNCKDVFVRFNSCVAADCDTNPFSHEDNRLLVFTNPDQVVNPHNTMNIQATIPAGYTMGVKCLTDDLNLPFTGYNTPSTADDCNNTTAITTNPVFVSANIFHGAEVTYLFTAPAELPCPAGSFDKFIADGTNEAGFPPGGVGDLLIKYDQFPAPNDNSYGANSIGWKKDRAFKHLVNSDHAGVRIRNPAGQVRLSFVVDYLSSSASAPSGYASLGVTGGDGSMLTGTATGISATTSLANNLNNINIPGLFNPATHAQLIGSVNILQNSPPTDGPDSYTITDAALAGWDFHNTYYIRISAAKLATLTPGGFNIATWTVEPNAAALHNSPPKECPDTN